jgi:hypothetical protein
MEKRRGHYLGTELDQKWWKRYRQENFFIRGNGTFWIDNQVFFFQRSLSKTPIQIPFYKMFDFKIGHWHCGRWSLGQPIIKIFWKEKGEVLTSGFVLTKTQAEAETLISIFRQLIP